MPASITPPGLEGHVEYEEITLTFPSGELVGPGQLQQWLDEINTCDELGQTEKDLALSIVLQVRALSN